MIAVEATYEKGAIKLGSYPDVDRCSVIVIFEIEKGVDDESHEWLGAHNSRLTAIWDNDEDSVYDKV